MNNYVKFIGNVVADPAIRVFKTGKTLQTVRIAVNEKDPAITVFVDLKVWNTELHETCATLIKGDLIEVEGRLGFEEWTSKEGSKRSQHVVIPWAIKKTAFVKKELESPQQNKPTQILEGLSKEQIPDLPF